MTTIDEIPFGKLEAVIEDQPMFWEARCNHCWFSAACWLEEEANHRALLHEECHSEEGDEHQCDLFQTALVSDPPDELGFGDGGLEEWQEENDV